MPRQDRAKLKVWEDARKERNSAYVDAIRARTVCEKCGAQPIHWHNELHPQHPTWRVSFLRRSNCSLERIQREIDACRALCARCHLHVDDRAKNFAETGRIAADAQRLPPRPCARCPRVVKKLVKGFCSKCYKNYRNHEMTDGWIVAIYRNTKAGERRYGFVAKMCVANGTEFSNTSACTSKPAHMKRWKTKAGADRAAVAYQRNNPGSRCESEPFHVGGRVEGVIW